MNFQQSIQTYFPGVISVTDFLQKTYRILQAMGFDATNTIACVGVCRDELTKPLSVMISSIWGPSFNLASLGGMLFLGKTGFSAANHHAPIVNGRERCVYFTLPHIAIAADGTIGHYYRPGREKPSRACGALDKFHKEIVSGNPNLEFDPLDIEQSLLKQRLSQRIEKGDVPLDLVQLTKLTYEVVLDDLEQMLSMTTNPAHCNYAVMTGIQIHGPHEDFIWPGKLYAVVEGQRRNMEL
ncbi:MAG: hypothetical protein KKD28_02605 [Chloroflexi bacterium]|nr:hypothetical protein [Chloroflexota bacterium]